MEGNIEVILVDIGNTRIKSAEVSDGIIAKSKTWSNIEDLFNSYPTSSPFMVCSTRALEIQSEAATVLDYTTPLPIEVAYDTPETLGMDRLAAAVGVYSLFPLCNSLIIDLGTCITMDLITKDGIFKGGVISPGLTMRMSSMADLTDNLPDIKDDWKDIKKSVIGKSTKECLLAGSYGGIVNEINGMYKELSKDFTSINVILTGGDAHHFESILKAHIFAGSKIVLTGLYRIWQGLREGNS